MGYYLWMGRTPGKMPIKKQELYNFIVAKLWSVNDDEDSDNDPTVRVMDEAPEGITVQAPCLEIRFSWATEEFSQALQFYLHLAHELEMDLFDDGKRVVTTDNFMTTVQVFNKGSAWIKRNVGVAKKKP